MRMAEHATELEQLDDCEWAEWSETLSFADLPPDHPDYDPTPYCISCGAMRKNGCHCGPIAENE